MYDPNAMNMNMSAYHGAPADNYGVPSYGLPQHQPQMSYAQPMYNTVVPSMSMLSAYYPPPQSQASYAPPSSYSSFGFAVPSMNEITGACV